GEPKPGQWFDGWENFGKTWDVGGADSDFAVSKVKNPRDGSDSPLETVPRWTTIWEENEDEMTAQMRANEIEARKRRRGSQSVVQRDNKKGGSNSGS
ncbi:MAG: hypothetical protein R3330_02810, partial [Saprospiraceae bacterium]|nr:hypothetical protein [Saprospiraceae bacterium]